MLDGLTRRFREIQEKDEKGFTLIELLVVIIIIGILAAIAIPAYLTQADRARDSVVEAEVRSAGHAVLVCMAQNSANSCDSDAELDAFGFNPSTDTTRAWSQPAANEVEVTVTHNGNSSISATFNSTDGNVS